jgi:purine-binding chemotaxis protein CheW
MECNMNVPSKAVAAAHKTAAGPRGGKYLSFHLDSEEYAIQVMKVREIVKLQHITAVPETPGELKGVINLRGKVIPVVDLRLRFGLPAKDYDQRTCIIVVELGRAASGPMGVIVDEVNEVITLPDGDIQDTPDFGSGVGSRYLMGMAKVEDSVKILLDIDEALANSDTPALAAFES